MIDFQRKKLKNGLTVIVHEDHSTPLCAVNTLYKVGSRNEQPHMTGFAHLFEHLMFGGSVNVPDFDKVLQATGGENNAYTTADYTNYYEVVPAQNIETAFYLESDRMLSLAFTPKSLEVQRKVVFEEFHQRYLNRPYGDIGHLMRDIAYKVHPYRWPTIGLDVSHIEKATMDDVRQFFFNNYAPDNAYLAVAGNVDTEKVFALAEKWFGNIERHAVKHEIAIEPEQTERRELRVEREVPSDYLAIIWHIGNRLSHDFYVGDIATDILAYGSSSRLIQRLCVDNNICSEVNATVGGNIDPGTLMLQAVPMPGHSLEEVEELLYKQLNQLTNGDISDYELQKVKNNVYSRQLFDNVDVKNKAASLSLYEMFGDAHMINTDPMRLQNISIAEISDFVQRTCDPNKASVLYYKSKQS
ncbi:MAG: insulinase family protein [Bacteroidales bacterium]|jgi:predicted Zn-dependent peptidase|nr:insulinase family protein [Bacteroidales bacterium]